MLRKVQAICLSLIFALIVLVLGNLLPWNGKTVSDQVKTTMAQVEKKGIEQSLDLLKEALSTVDSWIRSFRSDSSIGEHTKRMKQFEADLEDDLSPAEND